MRLKSWVILISVIGLSVQLYFALLNRHEEKRKIELEMKSRQDRIEALKEHTKRIREKRLRNEIP